MAGGKKRKAEDELSTNPHSVKSRQRDLGLAPEHKAREKALRATKQKIRRDQAKWAKNNPGASDADMTAEFERIRQAEEANRRLKNTHLDQVYQTNFEDAFIDSDEDDGVKGSRDDRLEELRLASYEDTQVVNKALAALYRRILLISPKGLSAAEEDQLKGELAK
ncbi:hypothetical protein KJ359_011507 [Pestalotiopsis sp. 9143b]|nr:hypothetical protein KJ359_011507 [Pestalotiopsis sp. 9143b]